MEETSIKQKARKKYLSFRHTLSEEEKEIISKELQSPEFISFSNDTGNSILIPEKYSAEATFVQIEKQIGNRKKEKSLYWSVAASLLLLISLGTIFFITRSSPNQLTVATGYGETLRLTLPDSSVVWLNSLSSVTYPSHFSKDERLVKLEGEGYFEIKKDQKKPFKITMDDISIEVLGTIFNTKNYDDENIMETTLLEGSIALHYEDKISVLVPGQTAIFSKEQLFLDIKVTNPSDAIQWKKSIFIFDQMSLKEILKILERKEESVFIVENSELNNLRLTAKFSHQESVEEILHILSESGNFNFEKQGKKYIINKK